MIGRLLVGKALVSWYSSARSRLVHKGTRSGSILVNALTVLLVWADPLLTLVCGHGHLDGVEHQADFVSSRDQSGQKRLESMTWPERDF
jgi:hypothetical protein